LLLNNYTGGANTRPAREELDRMAVLLAGLSQHSRDAPTD
jgi:hypothetical protein